jgi:hypothetical protein
LLICSFTGIGAGHKNNSYFVEITLPRTQINNNFDTGSEESKNVPDPQDGSLPKVLLSYQVVNLVESINQVRD